jgi:3-hydroxyisobutyrate dehydrogenase/2-hydroxy-3-oxopropionate reductase
MGEPMAERLLQAGHDLTVWNRTPSRAERLRASGATVAATPRQAADGAEAVVTMLSDPPALDEVLFADHGVAGALGDGSTLIEMSTVGPATIAEIAGRIPERVEVLDAPVFGSIQQASEGSLRIPVGGTPEGFERWKGLLEAMGEPFHVGGSGAGAAMKLVNNLALVGTLATAAEALALADALGLDASATLEVLSRGPVGAVVANKREALMSGEFPPRFKLALAVKDVGLVESAAGEAGLDLRVGRAAGDWFRDALDAGLGDQDYSAVTAHVRRSVPPA